MSTTSLHYRTCIVRAWHEETTGDDERAWRLTIETPATGVRRGFSSREEFIDALLQHLFADDAEGDSVESR